VRPADPLTFAGTAGVLLAVAAVAAIAPSLRILRIDPARTLRDE
jgi:ABC-type lipoprotein release transport system permease subunit